MTTRLYVGLLTSLCPLKLPDLSGLTLLVVDDNDDSLHMLGEFLRACSARVLQARGALAALSYVETQDKIHAVITDLSMPGMDGVEFVRRLRGLARGRSIPAIALTGFYEQYMDTQAAGFQRLPEEAGGFRRSLPRRPLRSWPDVRSCGWPRGDFQCP